VLPGPQRDWKRIDVELPPPCSLITRATKLAVVLGCRGLPIRLLAMIRWP
jgi:hypothetical protein